MHHHLGTGGQSRSLQQNLETGQEDPAVITDALRLPANPATNSSRKLVLTSSTQRKEEKKPAQSRGTLKGTGAAEQDVSAGTVLGLTALMAAASGLGAVPYFFVGTLSPRWSAIANAVACGVMLAASFDLVHEGEPYGPGLVIFGLMLGECDRQCFPTCVRP